MRRTLFLLPFLLFLCLYAQAQPPATTQISGVALNAATGQPLSSLDFYILSDSSSNPNTPFYYNVVTTDGAGAFQDAAVPYFGSPINYMVYAFDCNGAMVSQTVTIDGANVNTGVSLTFSMCSDTVMNPGSCNANFYYVQDSIGLGAPNSVLVNFFSVGYAQGQSLSYEWILDNSVFSTDPNPNHIFTLGQNYYVCLIVNNAATGCSQQTCQWVNLDNQPVDTTCSLSLTYSGMDQDYIFYANLVSPQPGGIVTNISWDFGDGSVVTTSNAFEQSHAYAMPGYYTVCVTADNAVCVDTKCITVHVTSPDDSTKGYLIGTILTDANTPYSGSSWVMAYYLNPDSSLQVVDSFYISANDTGYYYFNNLTLGNYIIRAVPESQGPNTPVYLPTYYGNTMFWHDATVIGVSLAQPAVLYDITLIPLTDPATGTGAVSAAIFESSGKTNEAAMADAVLMNANNQTVRHAKVPVGASFQFSQLPAGVYTLTAEIPGLYVSRRQVTIEDGKVTTGVELEAGANKTILSTDEWKAIGTVGALYPNPAVGSARLSLELVSAASATARLTNSFGQTVRLMNQNLPAGVQELSIDLNNLPAGLYTLQLTLNGKAAPAQKLAVR